MTVTLHHPESTTYQPQPREHEETHGGGQVRDLKTAEVMAYAEKPFRDQIVDEGWNAQALVADILDEPETAEKYRQKIRRNLANAAGISEKARQRHLGIPL